MLLLSPLDVLTVEDHARCHRGREKNVPAATATSRAYQLDVTLIRDGSFGVKWTSSLNSINSYIRDQRNGDN